METHLSAKKKIAYVCPRVPTPEACKTCERLMQDMPELEFEGINSLHDLFRLMCDPDWQADFAVIDIEECHRIDGVNMWELVNSLVTLNKLQVKVNGKRPVAIIAGITDTTPVELVREAIRCRDFACLNPIIGGQFTYEICLDSVKKYSNWDWTLPRCLMEMVAPKRIKKPKKSTNQLTSRQQQIYRLLTTRGASNKQIANTLKIAESTVKLHVSAILKKYNCRTRTQLSVFNR